MDRLKVLITGAKGYIAQSLIKALDSKYDITGISRDNFDLTNYASVCKFFEGKYFDIVIHTATVGGSRLKLEDDTVIQQNLHMYWNLMANEKHFGKFISFGSGAEIHSAKTPYGLSKAVISSSMFSKPNCLNIRIFAVFDENELPTRFIKANILRYFAEEDMIVHEDKRMDFFYMKDLIALVDYYLSAKTWNVSQIDCTYEKSYKLSEIARIINHLNKHRVKITVIKPIGKAYTGTYKEFPIPLIGLEVGITETYFKLLT